VGQRDIWNSFIRWHITVTILLTYTGIFIAYTWFLFHSFLTWVYSVYSGPYSLLKCRGDILYQVPVFIGLCHRGKLGGSCWWCCHVWHYVYLGKCTLPNHLNVGLATRHCDQRFFFVYFGVVTKKLDFLGVYSVNLMYIANLLEIILLKLQNRKER
jgi:hypothetical protein